MTVEYDQEFGDRIRNLVPLNTLTDDQFGELLSSSDIEQIAPGTSLFSAGDVDQKNIYLLAGSIALLQGGVEVEQVSAGSDRARYPLAHKFPRECSGRALVEGVLLRLDNRLVSELMSRNFRDGYEVEELSLGAADDWMEQLLGSRIIQLMPTANLEQVLRKMEQVELKQGERVFSQGDAGDYYYFISEGECRLTRSADSGPEEEVAKLGPGASFGEDALLSGSPRSCNIDMLSDGVLIRLSKENFEQLIKRPLSRDVGYGEAKRQVAAGAVWMDVRSPAAHASACFEGSINLPFDLLRYQMESLAQDRRYIIYCDDGRTSTAAAYLLTERNFQVAVLKRGLLVVPAADLKQDAESAAAKPGTEVAAKQGEAKPDADGQAAASDATVAGQLAQLERDLVEARERAGTLSQALEQSQASYQDLKQRHTGEIKALKQALVDARQPTPGADHKSAFETENMRLRQALSGAEAQLRKLTAELESMEDSHIRETDEVQQLWEKRLHQLEQRLERAQEERDQWRRRCQDNDN